MEIRSLGATPQKPRSVGTYLSAQEVLKDNAARALVHEEKFMISQRQAQHVPYACDIKL